MKNRCQSLLEELVPCSFSVVLSLQVAFSLCHCVRFVTFKNSILTCGALGERFGNIQCFSSLVFIINERIMDNAEGVKEFTSVDPFNVLYVVLGTSLR